MSEKNAEIPTDILQGRTRETKIRRDAQGRWYNDQVQITHQKLAQAFDRWLTQAENGRPCLKNNINWAYVSIEGPLLFIRRTELVAEPPGIWIHASNGRRTRLNLQTLSQDEDGRLYCEAQGYKAAFDRHAMLSLSEWIGEDERGIFIGFQEEKVYPSLTKA